MRRDVKGLFERIRNQKPITLKEFKKQIDVLLNYKGDIGAPVRLGFLIAPNIRNRELAYRFAQSLVNNVIQVILDKDPIKHIPGTGDNPDQDFLFFREHCKQDFSTKELGKIQKAFKVPSGMPLHMLLRAAKELKSDINKLPDIVRGLHEIREKYHTKKNEDNPYDDPKNWLSNSIIKNAEDKEKDEEKPDPGMMSKYLEKVWLRGAAIKVDNFYIVAHTTDMIDTAKRLGKDGYIRRLQEIVVRFAGCHRDQIEDLFVDITSEKYLPRLILSCTKKVKVEVENVDFATYSTASSFGKLFRIKDNKNRIYHTDRYRMNPESDTCKVKRAPGTLLHYAVRMPNRKEYIKTNLMKSSTQAIVAFPLVTEAFSHLSNGLVDEQGNGVIISNEIYDMLQEMGTNNAKFNIGFLKSKGIGIYRRKLLANVRGREIKIDAVFDLQESRGFDRAMFVPGSKTMKAYLEGKDEVKIKEGDKFTPVVGVLDGIPVLLGLYEMSIDLSVKRTVEVRSKRVAYPQMRAYAPKAWEAMQPLLHKSLKRHRYEIERVFQLVHKLNIIHKTIKELTNKETFKELNKVFDATFPKSKPTYPKELKHAYDIANEGIMWQDSDLNKEQIKEVLTATEKYFTLRQIIKLKPVKYLIKHDGRTMISPELRKLMHIVDRDFTRKGRKYTFENFYNYIVFILKNFRNTLQPRINVIGGKHATGAFNHGVVIPWKPELANHFLKQSTTLDQRTIEHAIEKGPEAVNLLIKKAMTQRDPVLKEIPIEHVSFKEIPMDVIIVGKETANYLNGDDDDDNVAVYNLKKDHLVDELVEAIINGYDGELDIN